MTDVNVTLFKGEKKELNFTIKDNDGNNINLTASNVIDVNIDVATQLPSYGESKFEKTGTDLSSDGKVKFVIEDTDTNSLSTGNYIYEVWVEYENGENYVAEVGKFFVKPRVDR